MRWCAFDDTDCIDTARPQYMNGVFAGPSFVLDCEMTFTFGSIGNTALTVADELITVSDLVVDRAIDAQVVSRSLSRLSGARVRHGSSAFALQMLHRSQSSTRRERRCSQWRHRSVCSRCCLRCPRECLQIIVHIEQDLSPTR